MELTKEEILIIKGVGEEPGWIVGISSHIDVNKEKVERILQKFKKLKLAEVDKDGVWTLTKKGEEVYTKLF
jgi:Mn-dependent DtxR family transcriptional regulator